MYLIGIFVFLMTRHDHASVSVIYPIVIYIPTYIFPPPRIIFCSGLFYSGINFRMCFFSVLFRIQVLKRQFGFPLVVEYCDRAREREYDVEMMDGWRPGRLGL